MTRARKCPILSSFENHIGPAKTWAGNCFGVAERVVEAKLVPTGSMAVYGHWLGFVHPKSMFAIGAPIVQHGWVLKPDGSVCDPTRWVFEHVKPYVYMGAADFYDEGGNGFRTLLLGSPPAYFSDAEQFELRAALPPATWGFIEGVLRPANGEPSGAPSGVVSYHQLYWLSNQDPRRLGEHAPALYAALDSLDLIGLVPWDNQQMVKRLWPAARRTSTDPRSI